MLKASFYFSYTVTALSSIFAMRGNPDKVSRACVPELTRGDLLCYMVGDRSLPALPTEPLVGRRVSTDGKPEGLRLPAIFVHPSFQTEDKVRRSVFNDRSQTDDRSIPPLHQIAQKFSNLFQNVFS